MKIIKISSKEDRARTVNNCSLESAKSIVTNNLLSDNPYTPETSFYMALSNILAAEAGMDRLLSERKMTESDFKYTSLLSLINKHKNELIEHGRLVS